jgi:signal transduction histidine kinase
VPGVFAVAYFPAEDRAEVLQVIRIVAVAGAVVLVATAVLAWTLAGRVLRPVRELTDAARTISDTDLSRRIPVTGDDELAELGHTFNEMVGRLEQGFRSQRQFLDDVAHELRTPITIARGYLEVLGDDPDERAETATVVTDELDRMNRYVDDLLVLAKAEERDFLLLEPVDVGELVTELVQRAAGLGERRWIIDAVPQPGVLAIIADPGRLTQALLNLAQNAVQHTADGDEIGVGADTVLGAGRRNVRLWVRDTGPGIDAPSIDQLFQRRFRGAASRSQRAEGMGIGLSIVDAIARAHQGTAGARNEPGGGARFTITLPVEPVDDEEDRP